MQKGQLDFFEARDCAIKISIHSNFIILANILFITFFIHRHVKTFTESFRCFKLSSNSVKKLDYNDGGKFKPKPKPSFVVQLI